MAMRLINKLDNKVLRIVSITLIGIFLCACEDEINPKLADEEPILNIDAWLNNKNAKQTIQISWSIDYDDNENLPQGVSGCIVEVEDELGEVFIFSEDLLANNGTYTWTPQGSEGLGQPGKNYRLRVVMPEITGTNQKYSNQIFTATSKMGDVPVVDDITFEEEEENIFNSNSDGYRAEFKAKDLPGIGNTYWIRTYKNGQYLNKPSEINIAYDAGTSRNTGFDGISFIPPIRQGINPNEVDENDEPLPPFELNDSVYVEINSITESAFNYLSQVISNTDRQTGIGSIFTSTPLSNSLGNIEDNGLPVVGFFNMAAVSGLGKRIR
jgi:Domain of unknown function (DUF4249)